MCNLTVLIIPMKLCELLYNNKYITTCIFSEYNYFFPFHLLQTSADFLIECDSLGLDISHSTYSLLTYDSVWTVALTLRKALEKWKISSSSSSVNRYNLEDFRYDTGAGMRREFSNIMGGLDFVGLSVSNFCNPEYDIAIILEFVESQVCEI